jgi:hypothetical protein
MTLCSLIACWRAVPPEEEEAVAAAMAFFLYE